MQKRIGLLVICLLLLIFVMPFGQANAQASLHVDAKIGFNNKIKYDHAVPLTVTITNNGEKFSGDFVIDTLVSYGTGSALVFPLTLESGEEKTLQIKLDGYAEDLNMGSPRKDYFHFYEGGMEEGEKVEYEGMHYVTPAFIDFEAKMVLAVTAEQERLKAVKQIRQFSPMTVTPHFALPSEVPSNVHLLEMVDVVLFDEGTLQELTDDQQQALYAWTKLGGVIVVGSEGTDSGPYADVLPFTFENTTIQVTPDELSKMAANGTFTQSIEIKEGEIRQGSSIISSTNGKVLAAQTPIGKGRLIQTTFPLGEQPLAGMTGYGGLLSTFVSFSTNPAEAGMQASNLGYGAGWTYDNELFPSFKFSAGWVIALIAIYLVIVGPVLYSVLKRVDKREHMWIYVPVISLVFSLSFFLYGAKDRLMEPQIQQMALYELQEDGSATGFYTNAVLSNKSGDFTFTMDDGTTAVANMRGELLSTAPLHTHSYIKRTETGQELTLKDMDYWSVQSFSGRTMVSDAGDLAVDLTVSDGKVTGTITNHLSVDLKDVKILNGNRNYDIGDLAKEQTMDVDVAIQGNVMLAPVNDYWQSGSAEDMEDLQARKLQQLTATTIDSTHGGKRPVLVAWSEQSILPVEYEGKHDMKAISFFSKPFAPKTELAGEVTFTHADFYVTVEAAAFPDANGYVERNNIEEAYIGNGDYRAIYTVSDDIDLSSMQLRQLSITSTTEDIEAAILNQATGQYELLMDGKVDMEKNIADYVKDGRKIEFKVSRVKQDDGMPVSLPAIVLKGVAAE